MIRLRSSRDVSIGYLPIVAVGFVFWIAYAIAIRNPDLVIPNALALIVGVARSWSPSICGIVQDLADPGPATRNLHLSLLEIT
jgi:hypothetical protein